MCVILHMVYHALRERGIKAYREEFKFILSPENNATRVVSSTSAKIIMPLGDVVCLPGRRFPP
jgi:hypothetical protein